jgi:hypothetical protein
MPGDIMRLSRLMLYTSAWLMLGTPRHAAGLERDREDAAPCRRSWQGSGARGRRTARNESPERLHMKRAGRIHRRPLGVPHDLMRSWLGRSTPVVVCRVCHLDGIRRP